MVNSVGKKLQQARLSKQISIEEASRVTRIRPDKLLDLEDDNYSNFPSMSYAKGFLLIYARFLAVDVRDFADSLHAPNPVSSDDYEYLNAAAVGPQPLPLRRPYHFSPRRERTILPVVVFAALAGAIILAIYLVVSYQRLGNLEDIADKKDLSAPAVSAASPAISTIPANTPAWTPSPVAAAATPSGVAVSSNPRPTLVAVASATAAAAPADVAAVPPAPASTDAAPAASAPVDAAPAAAAVQTPPPPPAEAFDPTREVRRAEPVVPTPAGQSAASPIAALPLVGAPPTLTAVPPGVATDTLKQISILPIRKTMVTIRKDVADSPPIFEDWLYPGDGPLKVSGHRLWIQVQDPSAVQITQDGQPLPAAQGDIQIE
jgi:cytoskeletal protein RodZ